MDLGIKGKRAIVCAASKGLGRACAEALAREGVLVTISARTREVLEATAREIEAGTGTPVSAVEANMLTPIELIKATVDGMVAREFGRIVNITSSSVKAPLPFLGLTNGVRSGLTGFVSGLAREVAEHGVTINNLLPGAFDTDRLHRVLGNVAERNHRTFEEQVALRVQSIPARRLGTAAEFGAFCAFVCSVHAGYVTAQNILLDGGVYPGTL